MSDDTPLRRQCGTMEVHRRLLNTDARYAERLARIEDQAFRARSGLMPMRDGCTLIPVVVHVVYRTAEENISMEQIRSQIDVLNLDFRKRNADVVKTPAPFAPLAGDARIQFELARTAPDGSATDGVIRVETTRNGFGSDDEVKSAASGGSDAWPRNTYLNLWVCRLTGGLLGYAQFPGGPAETDGVVITYTGFGTTGTAASPFNLGRTATHEIGHWLNLRHIWGDDGTGCSGTDFVDDTPNQGGENTGKPTFPRFSCGNQPNGDMFMNYMDYVDDDAMVMFTEGQITRMQACLDGPRSAIGSTIPCTTAPAAAMMATGAEGTAASGLKPLFKETVKDLPKEPFKDIAKDFPKEPFKDFTKDPPKDFPKDPPKDFPKDPPKDIPKDPPKDIPKDFPKDPNKEIFKDPPKEPVFDPGGKVTVKDWVKDPIFDPIPKQDIPVPPKGFEPPFEAPNVPFGQGAQPFVMATGRQDAAPQAGMAQVLAQYAQILQHYAGLHARGQLDAQGLSAWRRAYEAYRQLGGQ